MQSKARHRKENIILVDPYDRDIGTIEKILAHEYGMLHRAFSVLIFRINNSKLETLLQKRHPDKYHGGNLWSNACCSHPHQGDKIVHSAQKRLREEMGIIVKLKEVGKFHYIAQFSNGLTENEIDHVLIGRFAGNHIPFNKKEVADSLWVEIAFLQRDLKKNPEKYSPWLSPALEIAVKFYKKLNSF